MNCKESKMFIENLQQKVSILSTVFSTQVKNQRNVVRNPKLDLIAIEIILCN